MVPAAARRRDIRAPPVVERCRGLEPQERCIRVRTRMPSMGFMSFEEKGNSQRGKPVASKPPAFDGNEADPTGPAGNGGRPHGVGLKCR